MELLSSKYILAIKDNQGAPLYTNLQWVALLDKYLSQKTKIYIESGNLDLRVLASLIKDSIIEADAYYDRIDEILWGKLHDQDLVIEVMHEMGVI